MSVELLQTLSIVAYILSGVMLLVSIVLFFYLKIPVLWGEVSGRTAKKAIAAMKWKNSESEKKPLPLSLDQTPTATKLTAKIAKANIRQSNEESSLEADEKNRQPLIAVEHPDFLGEISPNQSTNNPSSVSHTEVSGRALQDHSRIEQTTISDSPELGNTSQLNSSEIGELVHSELGETAVLSPPEVGETAILNSTEFGETAVLNRSDLGETAVLNRSDLGETAVLNRSDLGETAVLNSPEVGETAILNSIEFGETAVLNHNPIDNINPLTRDTVGETEVLSTTAYREFMARTTGELPRCDETTLLDQSSHQPTEPVAFLFVLEKELAFTDSTEIIE